MRMFFLVNGTGFLRRAIENTGPIAPDDLRVGDFVVTPKMIVDFVIHLAPRHPSILDTISSLEDLRILIGPFQQEARRLDGENASLDITLCSGATGKVWSFRLTSSGGLKVFPKEARHLVKLLRREEKPVA